MKLRDTVARFKSCFISEVDIDTKNDCIRLIDTAHNEYFVDKSSDETFRKKFKRWFDEFFMSCKPQQLVILQFVLGEDKDEYVHNYVVNMWFEPKPISA